MRLREKTLELNFCAQFERLAKSPTLWFGLTQKQEARAGFDACTRLGGKLFIFQFKASAYILRGGARRFVAEHDQMQNLIDRCRAYDRSVFYVFPMTGTTSELTNNPDLMTNTWLLDVSLLPATIPPPSTKKGTARKNRIHYVDVIPPTARIHSEPFDVKLLSTSVFGGELLRTADGLNPILGDNFDRFYEFTRYLLRTSKGAVIL